MLTQKNIYLKTLLLGSLFVVIAGFAGILNIPAANAAPMHSLVHPTLQADVHRPDTGNVHGEEKAFHKAGQLHHRVKLTKVWLDKTGHIDIGTALSPLAVNTACNFSLSASSLRPGYYLFLFRLTPF